MDEPQNRRSADDRYQLLDHLQRMNAGEETVIVDTSRDKVHRLNGTAVEILDLVHNGTAVDITNAMVTRYPSVDRASVERDVESALTLFLDEGLIQKQT